MRVEVVKTPEKLAWTVRILTTSDEVESLRGFWAAWLKNPEADIDYFLLTLQRPEVVRPHVFVVYANGAPVAIVAGRIEDGHFEITSGRRKFFRFKVRRLALFYPSFLGRTDVYGTEFVARRLVSSLRGSGVDLMLWDGVEWDSPLRRLLWTTPNPFCRDYLVRQREHWLMRAPASLEELFQQRMSKKRRYWAKRMIRAVERDFPGAVAQRFSTPERVDRLWKDVMTIAKRSYQWELGVGLRESEEERERLEIAARKGRLLAWVLYLAGRPAAFWICTLKGDVLYLDYTGFDPMFGKYEVGTVSLFQIIAETCEAGIKLIDFGGGQYGYKQRFADHQYGEATILTFAPTIRGVTLNLLRTLTLGPIELVRWAAERLGLEAVLKNLWQRRHAAEEESRDDVDVSQVFAKRRDLSNPRVGVAIWRCLFVVLLMTVFYLAWKPSPSIAQVPWMPAWLGIWFDQHDFSKNVIGFAVLAAAGFMAWDGRRGNHRNQRKNSRDGVLFASFCLLVVILELGQLAMPRRVCDWADVLAGWLGIGLAWGLHRAGDFLRSTREAPPPVGKPKLFVMADRHR